MSVAAVDDLHQATGRDLNLVVGDKYNATVGGDMQERIEGLRKSVASVGLELVAPKIWVGSENTNVLQILLDLLIIVEDMNSQLSSHTHGPTPPPNQSRFFIDAKDEVANLNLKLKGVVFI